MLDMKMDPFVLNLEDPNKPAIYVADDFCWPKDTAECIAVSALKWEFIAACCRATQKKIEHGINDITCALCHKFERQYSHENCAASGEECPVAFAAKTKMCQGTDYVKYAEAETWIDASQIAEQFAAVLKNLKPVPKEPEFKGFCVGKSHDGFVGVDLVKGDTGRVVLQADIDSSSNNLISIDSEGVHLCGSIYRKAPFKDLLLEDGRLKTC
jgi:hypothetical protein